MTDAVMLEEPGGGVEGCSGGSREAGFLQIRYLAFQVPSDGKI